MKITAFDIEATDLAASWGRVLCCSFTEISPDMQRPVYTFRGDKRPHREGSTENMRYLPGEEIIDDRKLVCAIRDELESADIIVSWNGILYDVPMLNARLQFHNERPIVMGKWPQQAHLDLMWYARSGIRAGGSKLDTIAKFFGLSNQKTPLNGVTWQRASAGDRNAMNMVVEHCEADVEVLRELFPIMAVHVKKLVLPLAKWWPVAGTIELP